VKKDFTFKQLSDDGKISDLVVPSLNCVTGGPNCMFVLSIENGKGFYKEVCAPQNCEWTTQEVETIVYNVKQRLQTNSFKCDDVSLVQKIKNVFTSNSAQNADQKTKKMVSQPTGQSFKKKRKTSKRQKSARRAKRLTHSSSAHHATKHKKAPNSKHRKAGHLRSLKLSHKSRGTKHRYGKKKQKAKTPAGRL